jgi:hypothetical protein
MTETESNAKVLIVSLHHPELMRGGAQQIAYELFQGLQNEPGIEPVLLASTDDAYPALYKAGACITGFDQRPNEFLYLPVPGIGHPQSVSSTPTVNFLRPFGPISFIFIIS